MESQQQLVQFKQESEISHQATALLHLCLFLLLKIDYFNVMCEVYWLHLTEVHNYVHLSRLEPTKGEFSMRSKTFSSCSNFFIHNYILAGLFILDFT